MKGTALKTKFAVIAVVMVAALVAVLALSGVAWAAGPLVVTKTVPSGGATGVAPTANIDAYFNQDVAASTVTSRTFKIRKKGTTTWLGATRSVNNTISPTSTNGGSESVVTLNPKADLAPNTIYQVVIVGGTSGVKGLGGEILSTTKRWTFTTANTTTSPDTTIDSGPTGTVTSDSASFSFSSSLAGSTFECRLDGSAFAACTSPKSYSGLANGPHTFEVRAKYGTAVDSTPATRSWTVDTTATTPLSVVSYAPTGSPTPDTSTNVTATFSNAMDSATINATTFTLTGQYEAAPVAAQVTLSSDGKTAILNPDSNLTDSKTYTAVIKGGSNGVKDTTGNSLAQDFSWSFMPCYGTGVVYSAQSVERQIPGCG